jgi:hypothetical protein
MLVKDIGVVEKQLVANNKGISNLVNAIVKGADPALLLDKQTELKNEKQLLESRRDELTQTLTAMPDPEHIAKEAMFLRIALIERYKNRDWRSLSYEEVRRFLHFLFGDNPMPTGQKQTTDGYGISVIRKDNKWILTFRGLVEFYHEVVDGRPVGDYIFYKVGEKLRAAIKRDFKKTVETIKPFKDNK